MIKPAHSIRGLKLGFWKRPFSQAQHSAATKWCNTSNKDAIWRSAWLLTVHLSTQRSRHASPTTLSTWRILSYSAVGILRRHTCREKKKLRSGRQGLHRSAHCIVPTPFTPAISFSPLYSLTLSSIWPTSKWCLRVRPLKFARVTSLFFLSAAITKQCGVHTGDGDMWRCADRLSSGVNKISIRLVELITPDMKMQYLNGTYFQQTAQLPFHFAPNTSILMSHLLL